MKNSKVVFICAPYDAKDRADHVQEMERVAHFRNVVEGLYHYKTFAPGSYITGPEKEARDFRVEVEDIIQKTAMRYLSAEVWSQPECRYRLPRQGY